MFQNGVSESGTAASFDKKHDCKDLMQLAFSPYSSPEPEGISDVLLAKHRYELVLRKSVPPLIIAARFFI